MRAYLRTSGVVFALVALVQLVRLLLLMPIDVAGFQVPLWPSGVACGLAVVLSIWAFRLAARR